MSDDLTSEPGDEEEVVEAMARARANRSCEILNSRYRWDDSGFDDSFPGARREALAGARAALTALRPHLAARDAETRKRALEDAYFVCDRIWLSEYSKPRGKQAERRLSEIKMEVAQVFRDAIRALIEREAAP